MVLIISIAAGVLALAGLIVFLVIRKKKKARLEAEMKLRRMQELDEAISNSVKPSGNTALESDKRYRVVKEK